MSNYELTLVINSQASALQQKQATDKIKQLIADLKGDIDQWDDWGPKTLAYPIKGQTTARYYLAHLELPPTAPTKINQVLRTEKNLLRYLLVKATSPKLKPQTKLKTKTKPKPKAKPKPKLKTKAKLKAKS